VQRLQVATRERDDTKRLISRVSRSSISKPAFLQIGMIGHSQLCIKSNAKAEFSPAISGGQNKNGTGLGSAGFQAGFRLNPTVEFIYECNVFQPSSILLDFLTRYP